MRRVLALVLHATAACILTWGWFSLTALHSVDDWVKTQKGGYSQFLTNQGLFATWSCMVASLFSDLFPSVAVFRRLKRMLLMISMPLELVISAIYWPLFLFLPHLILRLQEESQPATSLTAKLPPLLNLTLHALPLLSLLVDFFVFESKFSTGAVRKAAPVVVVVFAVWYTSLVEYYASFNGSFPYPFLTRSPLTARLLIYTTSIAIALGGFSGLNASHR